MAAGKTQKDFAIELEIDPSYLSHLEANRKEPSLALLRKIAEVAEIPTGLLLAIVMLAELPAQKQELYGSLVERILELSNLGQFQLDLP